MKLCLVFIFAVLLTGLTGEKSAWADIDLSVGAYSRSYPLGGSLELNLGYSATLWGQSQGRQGMNPFLGYVRLSSDLDGVEDYFSSTVKLEIFPVSFFGVRFGKSWMQNHLDYKGYDCEVLACRGEFNEQFFEVPLFLSYKNIIFVGSFRKGQWENVGGNFSAAQVEFIEPSSGLSLNLNAPEEITRYRGALMYQVGESFRIGYSETYYSAEDMKSSMWMGYVQYVGKNLTLTAGGGEYSSHILNADPTVILALSYSLYKKIGY